MVALNIGVSLTTASLPQSIVGQAYSYDLKPLVSVTGDPSYTANNVAWSITSGVLPSGLTLNGTTGIISGTPTVVTPATGAPITVQATYRGKNGQKEYVLISIILQATITDVNFGGRDAGTSTDLNATLSNTGTGTLSIAPLNSSSVSGGGFAYKGTTCGSTLAPNESCNITVTYTATGMAAAIGTVSAETNAGPKSSKLTGQSLQAVATRLSAETENIAGWYGATTQAVQISYRNDGNKPLTLTFPQLSAPLTLGGSTCSNVAAGETCSVSVMSDMSGVAGGSGTQKISPTGAQINPAPTEINWAINTAVPRWETTALDFGNVEVGKTATKTIKLFNDGNTGFDWATNNTTSSIPPEFTVNTAACSSVGPGGSCDVSISFTPDAIKSYSAPSVTLLSGSWVGNNLNLTGSGISSKYTAEQFASTCTQVDGGPKAWLYNAVNSSGRDITVVGIVASTTPNMRVYVDNVQIGTTYNTTSGGSWVWPAGTAFIVRSQGSLICTTTGWLTLYLSNGQTLKEVPTTGGRVLVGGGYQYKYTNTVILNP